MLANAMMTNFIRELLNVSDSNLTEFYQLGSFAIFWSKCKQKMEHLYIIKLFTLIIIIIIVTGLFLYFRSIDSLLLFIFNLNWKYLKVLCMVLILLFMIYFLITMLLCSLFYVNNMNIPRYLPKFIQFWLNDLKFLTENTVLWNLIKLYLKQMYILIFVLSLLIFNF